VQRIEMGIGKSEVVILADSLWSVWRPYFELSKSQYSENWNIINNASGRRGYNPVDEGGYVWE
jgi:hypothetical protein